MQFEASPAEDITPTLTDAPLAGAGEENTDANAAASSPADEPGAKEPANLLDVVKSAVEKSADPAASPPAEGSADQDKPEGEGDKPEPEAKTDADADLPFHNHPRWQEVIAERDSFKEDAGRYRNITGFMDEHGLATEEVVEGFEVMALLKSGQPEKLSQAREYFATRLQQLDGMLGNILDDDLQERVNSGELDEAGAQEIAGARAQAKLLKASTEAREKADTEAETARQAAAAAQAQVDAVEGWEARIKASDPDYAKKAKLVETTCRAIVHRTGKAPTTPEEAVKLCEDALAEVNEQFAAVVPKPKPISPTPQGSSKPAAAAPKTLREAIAASIGG